MAHYLVSLPEPERAAQIGAWAAYVSAKQAEIDAQRSHAQRVVGALKRIKRLPGYRHDVDISDAVAIRTTLDSVARRTEHEVDDQEHQADDQPPAAGEAR